MTTYNWANLSDHDFEGVCRDVMAVLVKGPVEAFTRGRDGGVDLRFVAADGTLTIGQAKHYMRSRYESLVHSIAAEKLKMDTLRPARYILFTSAPLTPARKADLIHKMAPHINQSSDVLGLEDIEGILANNPKIEEHHYKLWLSSARVLGRILGSATLTRSQVRIEEVLERAKLFVPHAKLNEATDILTKEHCLIISGPAGIGKTTMAEMLALRFLEAGFVVRFVASVEDLEEGLERDEKQVFLYDDFLGRTNFKEAPSASAQERLFGLMRYIAKRPNRFFILTTREYLYREAQAANDRLAESRADLMRCVLGVDGYSRTTRATILYNHLYWTPGLAPEALADFVRQGGHWSVIEHPNFNPRWIADTLNRLAHADAFSEGGPPWT